MVGLVGIQKNLVLEGNSEGILKKISEELLEESWKKNREKFLVESLES